MENALFPDGWKDVLDTWKKRQKIKNEEMDEEIDEVEEDEESEESKSPVKRYMSIIEPHLTIV
jgi:hypothetical protein